ncbi:nucleotide sugar dehydrogenase, partial [candidate division KSB1 bacterium]|nr:nucleotide sugar dehydrogenase [candidate division KSB1 bacterium]
MAAMTLEQKVKEKSAKVGIVGLGYVGLPLAVEFASKGFYVLGIDTDRNKIEKINRGENYIDDIDSEKMRSLVGDGLLEGTTMYGRVGELDIIFICVPTPFTPNKEPDISYINQAAENISAHLRKEQLVILKSTTFPETTEKVVLPILESTGLKVGKDFYLAFSPERIDPGRQDFTTATTPIIVGGVTKKCTELATFSCEQIINEIVPVSSPRVAEMAKLLENIFRSVNIALVNELAQLCERMGNIDIWEVVQAAATKPFGFMPFYPSAGAGGHCIPKDPRFLLESASKHGFKFSTLENALQVNSYLPKYIVDSIENIYDDLNLEKSIIVCGLSYKPDIEDMRDSPGFRILNELIKRNFKTVAYDPFYKT